jgi:leucine dehydrogenase
VVRTVAHPHASDEVHVFNDESAGLECIIVLNSRVLGPAAGGCRLWSYETSEEMTVDAFRLAEGMSYKNALAGLPLGGGKAVLKRPAGLFDRRRLFAAFGEAVRSLNGVYITAEDVGTTISDMLEVAKTTHYVAGLPPVGELPGGDPSPWTARGTFLSMEVAAMRRLGRPLSQCTVAVQGLGSVGSALARMLHAAGAKLVVADVNGACVSEIAAATGAHVVSPGQLLSADVDILAPCALGGVLAAQSIGSLKARVVCGAANNQLAVPGDGERLADAGILYAPDYVVNAGGMINVAAEYLGWSSSEALDRVEATGARLAYVLDLAESSGLSTNIAADQLARSIIANDAAPLSLVAA